jgi:DNA-directed RNA polymerase
MDNLVIVHDCFGTSINGVEALHELIRDEFARLYRDDFLMKFHQTQVDNIKQSFKVVCDRDETYVEYNFRNNSINTHHIKLPKSLSHLTKRELFDVARAIYCIY